MSVVVPVLNEERHLAAAVGRLLSQRYDGPIEVVLALGPSKDATDEVAAELAAVDPRVRIVDNPTGRTPSGLNAAIKAATHKLANASQQLGAAMYANAQPSAGAEGGGSSAHADEDVVEAEIVDEGDGK